jgi:DNA-binding response OmpR family regulator
MRILIIEDEAYVARMLADSLRVDGHEPIIALGAEQGIAMIEREDPQAVFLDLVMPDVSGLEVLRQIREKSPHLPVVIVTGYASPSEVDEARRLGVADIIEKPFVLRRLNAALGAVEARRPHA